MVSLIAKYIDTIRSEDIINGESKNHSEEYASLILHSMETSGMLPPPIKKEVYAINDEGIHYKLTYRLQTDPITGDHTNNWEPEDA